jgi:hypothetical protein
LDKKDAIMADDLKTTIQQNAEGAEGDFKNFLKFLKRVQWSARGRRN